MPNYNDDPNMVPLMRMSPYGGYQKPVSKYSKPDNAMPRMKDLKEIPEGNKGKGLRAMAAKGPEGKNKVEDFGFDPLSRKMKYCGGTSKPYGRKK